MDATDKLSISQLVWYFLPGLYALFIVLVPSSCLMPHLVNAMLTSFGTIGIALVALVLGFLVDGLRLYRLRPKYHQIRKAFFADLKAIVAVPVDPYFILDQIVSLAEKKTISQVRFNHSIWIMLGQMTVLTYFHAVMWAAIPLVRWYFGASPSAFGVPMPYSKLVSVCAFVTLASILVAYRLTKMSLEEQSKTNTIYLNYLRANKAQIIKAVT